MKRLIGFNGKKGSGKDTSGNMLSELTGIDTYAFADPLKMMCQEIFNFTEEDIYGETKEVFRQCQLVNWKDNLISQCRDWFAELVDDVTDEELCQNFYKKVLLPYLFSENEPEQRAMITTTPRLILQKFGTDFARTINDKVWIYLANRAFQSKGAMIVTDVRFDNEAQWIKDNGGLVVSVLRDEVENSGDSHASESGISKDLIDVYLDNNGSVEELENGIQLLLDYKISSTILRPDDVL